MGRVLCACGYFCSGSGICDRRKVVCCLKYKLSNSSKGLNKNLMLHSYQIRFMINEVKHTYTALLPEYFKKLLKAKRLNFLDSK